MNQVTAGLENSVTYIDDIIVHNDTWNEHVTDMRQLFERLRQANLVVNLKKSEFAKAKVVYLGHVVGHGSVAPRQAKVEATVHRGFSGTDEQT